MKAINLKPELKPGYLDTIEEHETFFLVRLSGELATHAIEHGRDKMSALIRKFDLYSKSILCDFDRVTESDTATIAALIKRFSDFRKRGRNKMVFFGIRGELRELFEIARLKEVFSICENQEEAEKFLSA